MVKRISWPLCGLLAVLLVPTCVTAQSLETLGARGAGLSAFVAVADDASAVAWNPAGLKAGPIFNISFDLARSSAEPDGPARPDAAAGRLGSVMVAAAALPVGLTYYRVTTLSVSPSPAGLGTVDRQTEHVIRSLITTHLGATVLQSVGEHLTIGATLKLVRGRVAQDVATVASWSEGFERADRLDGGGNTRGDVDIGAMFAAGRVRAGVVVRNAAEPTFGGAEENAAATLQRHVRLGAAWGEGWPGLSRTLVAVDADITRVMHPEGDRRDLAAGAERWFRDRRIGVRAGVRASTLGEARPRVTAGGSYAVRGGIYVDAYAGRGAGDRRWGIAARVTY